MHCKQWLDKTHPELLAFHVANERRGGIGTGVHFRRMGVLPGVADWLIFPVLGRALAVELKDEDGDMSPAQKDFARRWQAAGNSYVLARSLQEFKDAVETAVLFP